nr:hypothetical protein NPIL_542751 [Nephila pilipes]
MAKFIAKTESILDSSVEDTDSDEIIELLEHINKKENDLNIVNSEIEIAITDPTVFDNEFKTSDEYSDKITIIKFRIKNKIQKINALDNSVVERRENRPAQFACLKLPKTHTTTTPEITPSAPGPALDMETSTTMDTNAPSGESLESFLESVRVDALRSNLSSIQNSSDYLSIAIFAENKLNCLSNFMFPDINVSNNISVNLIKIIEEARLKFSILKHQ